MTLDGWLKTHAFLGPLARVNARVEIAIEAAAVRGTPVPDWNDYRADFAAGVPLLQSTDAAIDLDNAAAAIVAVTRTLGRGSLDGAIADDLRVLAAELPHAPNPRHIVEWLLGHEGWAPSRAGTLRYVGWRVLARALAPLVREFSEWRDDERWLRRYCPTCGSLPAMAHLVGTDPGRRRYLSCGCCETEWRFGRTDCPFCEVKSDRLASLDADGEAGLRIDYCESCRGYLKTYGGEGDEAVLLADWTSVHLDLAARDRGLQRRAASLYEL